MTPRTSSSAFLLLLFGAFAAPGPGGRAHAQCDHFRRGDSNGDGRVDLSDAVNTLGFLFAGGGEVHCDDAADADDSGSLLITDAIYELGWLFQGGPAPPAPGPFACGRDETFDELSCVQQDACDPQAVDLDFSEFARFDFERQGALGFCVEAGQLLSARITKEPAGAYKLERQVLRKGDPAVDECIPGTFSENCLVAEPLEPRALSQEEAAEMLRLSSAVQAYLEPDPICECVAIDPCVITRFRWDDSAFSGFLCSAPYLEGSVEQALVGFLDGLP